MGTVTGCCGVVDIVPFKTVTECCSVVDSRCPLQNCHWVLWCCKRSLPPSNCHWVLWCCRQPLLQKCHCVLLYSGRSLPLSNCYRVSHSHHENGFYIKTGTCESHFNVSLTARRIQSQESVHKPQPLKRKKSRRPPLTSLTPYRWAKTGSQSYDGTRDFLLYARSRWECRFICMRLPLSGTLRF